jgi:hypothetical protein
MALQRHPKLADKIIVLQPSVFDIFSPRAFRPGLAERHARCKVDKYRLMRVDGRTIAADKPHPVEGLGLPALATGGHNRDQPAARTDLYV